MNRKWMLGMIVVLVVFSMACSLTNILNNVDEVTEKAQEIAESVEDITEGLEDAAGDAEEIAAAEEIAGAEEVTGDDFDPNGLDKLDSYRLTIEFRSENVDSGIVEETHMEIAYTRDPKAEHTIMTGGMGGGSVESVEIVQIENQQWMKFGTEWMYSEVAEGEEDFSSDAMAFEDISEADLAGAKDLGKDTVNGIRCRHYEFDETMAGFAADIETEDVEEVYGEIWIAAEKGLPAFMVRYEVEMSNKATDDAPAEKMYVTMNVTDVNSDIVIEPPAEAEAATGTEAGEGTGDAVGDVPMMPDAQNQTIMGDIIFYDIESSFQAVVDFYAAEMESAGWTKEATTMSIENLLMETWSKDGNSLQLTITAEEGSDVVSVMIMKESNE